MPKSTRYAKRAKAASGSNYSITAKRKGAASAIKVGTDSNTVQYSRSLANPFAKVTPKIPDLSTQQSHSFQTELDFQWDPNSAGADNGLMVAFGNTDRDAMRMPIIRTSTKLGTSGGLRFTTDTTGTNGGAVIANPALNNIQNAYSAVRIVSCGLYCEYTGPDTNNSGVIRGCQINSAEVRYGNAGGTFSANPIAPPNNSNTLWDEGKLVYDGATAWNYGVSNEMIDNARISYTGPAKNGIYMTYRPLQSEFKFAEVRQESTTPANGILRDTMFIIKATTENAATVLYQCKLVINWEGIVLDTTYPRPDVGPSPMDIYGYQAAVESALATPCIGSLSEGISSTFNSLEKKAVQKFAQIVALSQGR